MTRTFIMGAGLLALVAMAGSAVAEDERWKVVKKGVVEDTFAEVQWTQRDNLGDINWNDAKTYCSSLSLDGGGWQLPTMQDLSMLHAGAQGNKVPCSTWQCTAPKAFYLTGPVFWSGEQGESSSEAWYFLLLNGYRLSDTVSNTVNTRALCVRRRS
jgi:hypothetical protein